MADFEKELDTLLAGVPANVREKIMDRLPDRLAGVVREVAHEVVLEVKRTLPPEYQAELAKIRRGDVRSIVALRNRWRRRGWDV